MSFNFNSQIKKLKDKANTTEYSIQITTDNKEQYLFMQEMARQCVDGKHKTIQGDTKAYGEHYECVPSNEMHINLPDAQTYSYIPNCCKNCPNHISNGGSGICNCTLPYFEQSTTATNETITLKTTKHN